MLRGQQENLAMGDGIKTTNLQILQIYAAFQDLLSFPHSPTDDFSVLESIGDAMKQMAESTAPKSKVKCCLYHRWMSLERAYTTWKKEIKYWVEKYFMIKTRIYVGETRQKLGKT